jgi:hypothetical protein
MKKGNGIRLLLSSISFLVFITYFGYFFVHDRNLSARYPDHIFAIKSGKLIAKGTPRT